MRHRKYMRISEYISCYIRISTRECNSGASKHKKVHRFAGKHIQLKDLHLPKSGIAGKLLSENSRKIQEQTVGTEPFAK